MHRTDTHFSSINNCYLSAIFWNMWSCSHVLHVQEGFGCTMKGRASKKKLPRRSLGSHSHITKGTAVQNHHRNNHGAADAGAPSVEKDLASLKATIELPPSSFEFYVWSDEGISLHVNLNSSPSDWTKRFKKDVCVTENLKGNESWSFWQDLGRFREKSAQRNSSLQNTLKSLGMTGNFSDKLKDNQTIASAALTADMAGNLKKGQSTVSAELSYGAPNNFMSGAESCAKYASKEILDSDVPDASFRKSLWGSVGNSLSDPGKLELQNPKSGNEISEDFTLLKMVLVL